MGFFDEKIFYGSDVDFTWRITDLGYKIRYKKDVIYILIGGKLQQEIKSLIIGDGTEKKYFEALTQNLKMEKNIKFLGFLKNDNDVYALMKSSKVFVLPSTREGFGIVVIEANACGIPVITIEHKDNAARDLIEEGKNGFVCQLNEREIAKRIIRISENNSGRKMRKACKELAKKYDWDKIVDEIEEVYKTF